MTESVSGLRVSATSVQCRATSRIENYGSKESNVLFSGCCFLQSAAKDLFAI